MERLRKKINERIEELKEEYDSYYKKEATTKDDDFIKGAILKEIELLQWVVEESYKVD